MKRLTNDFFWPIFSGLLLALLVSSQYEAIFSHPPLSYIKPLKSESIVHNDNTQTRLSFAPTVKKTIPAVVSIYNNHFTFKKDADNKATTEAIRVQKNLGSGVIVRADGYILTNLHVVLTADEIIVQLSNNEIFIAYIVSTDPTYDLAVLKINKTKLTIPRSYINQCWYLVCCLPL